MRRHLLQWTLSIALAPALLCSAAAQQTSQRPVRRPAARSSTVPSYKDLKYPPLRPVRIPKIETATLPNGMKLYLLEDHELPLVSGTALVRTGNLFDPADKVGLATITGHVMRTGGTKTKTGDQLDVELENIAASVESGIGETSGSVSFSCLKENADEVLGIFRDVLTSPEFRQDKIDLFQTQLRSAISRRNDDPGEIAQREFYSIVYGRNTPYGWRMEYATVDNIKRDDLIAFYKRYFFPANIMLAIRGDFSAPEMKAKIEKLFAGWNYQQPPVPPFPKVREKPEPGIYLATKNDITQTTLILGHLDGEVRDKDYPALSVMSDILGGGFQSRLFKKVRTELGYAYNISSAWAANYDHPGVFLVSGSTKSPTTTDTLKTVEQEIDRIRSSEVTADELKTAKDTTLNSFVFAFDTKGKTLSRLLTYEYFGYPKDFIYQYQKAVAAVTRADILRVAKQHLRPDDLTIVAVGKPQDFGAPLSELGKVTPIDLTIPQPKEKAAKADAATLAKGKQLLERAQQSVGGTAKLAAVKDVLESTEYQMDTANGSMKVQQTMSWIAPSYFRQVSQLPFGQIVAYTDGKTGWIHTPRGTMPLGGPQMKQTQAELFRLFFRLLLSDRDPNRAVNYVGDSTIEISGKEGQVVRLSLDENTGLPAKISFQAVQVRGAPTTVEETLSDWKDVDGIKMPFKIEIHQSGRKFAEVIVKSYKLNSGLKVEDMEKRP